MDTCLACQAPLENHGVMSFRTGGHRGAAKFFLGEFGELGEDMLPLEVLSCTSCRRVEFRVAAAT